MGGRLTEGHPCSMADAALLIASSEAIKALGLGLEQEWVQTEPFALRHVGIVTLSVMEPNVPPSRWHRLAEALGPWCHLPNPGAKSG